MKYFLFNRIRNARLLKQHLRESVEYDKPLSVMEDYGFKAMLTSNTEDSRQALKSLLSACTRREISSFRILNNEILPAHLEAKPARLDVNITFNDGELANLEMQIEKTDDDLKARAIQYAAVLMAGHSVRGQPYGEIKRVYQVFFLNCILFPESNRVPRRYRYLETEEHDHLTDTVEIVFYELPKLEQKVRDYFSGKAGTETLSEEEKWCIYIKYRHEKLAEPLIKELCKKEEGIMFAEKSLSKADRRLEKYLRNMSKMKAEWEREAWLNRLKKESAAEGHAEGHAIGHAEGHAIGHAEGHAEGHTEGHAKGLLEAAKNLKAAGISTDIIFQTTGIKLEN
jgi:predicted transposase/invertase (TIGR01784 family)